MHSPNVVADDEVLEREPRRNVERPETGKPTEAAFPRKRLLGKNGTGLSVNRLLRPESEEEIVASQERTGDARACVIELWKIADRQGRRTASVAGTKDNRAEIYVRLNGANAGPKETRARVLNAFGGRPRSREPNISRDEGA